MPEIQRRPPDAALLLPAAAVPAGAAPAGAGRKRGRGSPDPRPLAHRKGRAPPPWRRTAAGPAQGVDGSGVRARSIPPLS